MAISSRMTSRSASTSAGGEQRAGDHVAEHVDRQRQVLVEDPRVEAGVLLGGEGVELAADRVERDRDVERRALLGALEEQVLEEVRAAVQARRLVARADADPHADAGRADAGHVLGDDPQAAGQDRTPHPEVTCPHVGDGLQGPGRDALRALRGAGTGRPASRACWPVVGASSAHAVITRRRASAALVGGEPSVSSTTGISDSLPRSSISAIWTWIFWPTETTSSTVVDPLATGERRAAC